jgi:hypothetical protein
MHWGAMAFVFVLAVEKSANATASKAPHRVAIGMASRKDHAGISLSPHPSVHRLTPLPRRAATILPLARSGGAARQALQRYIYRIFRGLMPWSVPGMPKRLTTSSGNCFLSLVQCRLHAAFELFGFCEFDPHQCRVLLLGFYLRYDCHND